MQNEITGLPPTRRGLSLAEQIYRNLRRAIITGQIKAGTRLREVELAEMFGASRTPLREATSRLAGDGLLRALARGGVEVVDVEQERDDIHAIRVGLECTAARLAALRVTTPQLAELYQLVEAREAMPVSAVAERSENNSRLHALIRDSSHCPRLVEMIDQYREFFLDAERIGRLDEADSARAAAQHREIVDALAARDPDTAEQALRRHLEQAYDSLKRVRD